VKVFCYIAGHRVTAAGRAFLEQLPVTAADRERIARSNAEKLFNW
jgi:hypothetical protein